MAYIRRIRIENYRSIKSLDVDLTPPEGDDKPFRHLILTGPNGSGKTSALEFIARPIPQAMGKGQAQFKNRTCELEFTDHQEHGNVLAFFKAQRALKMTPVAGPAKIEWTKEFPRHLESHGRWAAQYLVNRKTEQAFALAEGDHAAASSIEAWFSDLQGHLARILEDRASSSYSIARISS